MPTAFASRVNTAVIHDNIDDEFLLFQIIIKVLILTFNDRKRFSKIYEDKNKKKEQLKF